MIRNPILPGFNADPSVCRVGEDYYIATATGPWRPGIQIHHSRDLANWTLVARPLASWPDLAGVPDGGGITGPDLTHAEGRFFLLFGTIRRGDGSDLRSAVTSAPAIDGPWSEPAPVVGSAADLSLFHDGDGRAFTVGVERRQGAALPPKDGGDRILLRPFDLQTMRATGPETELLSGIGGLAAPHLVRRGGWLVLTVSAGAGTILQARGRRLDGPFEPSPHGPLLSAEDSAGAPLRPEGRARLVETPQGEAYLVCDGRRPLAGTPSAPLGRETMLMTCAWRDDDWLQPPPGGPSPTVPAPGAGTAATARPEGLSRRFDEPDLPPEFQWLRLPEAARPFTLTGEALRLAGGEALGSWYQQALVARRQEHHHVRAGTVVEFAPEGPGQAAGLVVYRDRGRFHFLAVTGTAGGGRGLAILVAEGPSGSLAAPLADPVDLPADGPVGLAVQIDGAALQFFAAVTGDALHPVGPVLSIDDGPEDGEGTFIGMAAIDLTGAGRPADFSFFDYHPIEGDDAPDR